MLEAGAGLLLGEDFGEPLPELLDGSQANCVEVATRGRVLVRDTKDSGGPALRFTPAAWRRFAVRVKAASLRG